MTEFFDNIFRQYFSPRNFDKIFRQHFLYQVEWCRIISKNAVELLFYSIFRYDSTKKLKIFRQRFSTRIFDSKFRHYFTNFDKIFVEIYHNLSKNIVELKSDSIFWQHFSTAFFAKFLRHSPLNYCIRQNFLSNAVEYCLKILSKTAVEEFDSTVRQILQRSLVNLRGRLSNCGEALLLQNSTKKLKKKYPHRGGYFLFLF